MMLVPVAAAKTITWLTAGSYLAAGAGISAGVIYAGNKISSLLSPSQEEELQKLEAERQNLTNARLEQVAADNQKLNLEAQDAKTQNNNELEHLAEINKDSKEASAQTKMVSKELQCVALTLRNLSIQLDDESKKVVASLEKHLSKINQDLYEANDSLQASKTITAELTRLQNLCHNLEEIIKDLRTQKNAEVAKLEKEKQALAHIVQQANSQALQLLAENETLKTENQNLLSVNHEPDKHTQNNLRFFSR